MTIRGKLALNAAVVLVAIVIIVLSALNSARKVDQHIGILTQKTTPYQIKALNQQRELQAHSANLVALASSTTLEDYKKNAALVSNSLSGVNQATVELARLKGEEGKDNRAIEDITRGVLELTEKKLKAEEEVMAASKTMQERLSDVAKRLDAFVKSMQQKNSGTMISGVDTLMNNNQQLHNLNLIRNGLNELHFTLSKIPSAGDRRTVVALKDHCLKVIKEVNGILKNTKGMENVVKLVGAKLAGIQEKLTKTNGIVFLQLRYVADEDPSMGEKIETMVKEAGYELTYLIPAIDKALVAASNVVKIDTMNMAGNMDAFKQNNNILSLASNLSLLSASLVTAINNCIYSNTLKEFEAGAGRVEQLFREAAQGGARLQQAIGKSKNGDEQKLVLSFLSALATVRNTFSSAGGVADKVRVAVKNKEELVSLNAKMREITTAQLRESQQLVAQAGANQESVIVSVNRSSKRNIQIISVVGGGIILITLLLAVYITRSITRPIHRVVTGLLESSNQVAAASEELSSSSQSLAEGASQQAAGIEETSSSMEEMSAMTRHNAENANQANTLMMETTRVVEEANQSMEELSRSMQEITLASEETAKIIKTIDEIAFQTNLLALNAAVEAARAGEAGAGFATVADEVRNLALRAAEAAKNTNLLIEGTVKKIRVGAEVADRANQAFAKVAGSARKVGEIVSEIRAASQEQAQGIEQINKAITEMERIVQRNAANAEESASASEEMNAQAEHLKAFVQELALLVGRKAFMGEEEAETETEPHDEPIAYAEMEEEPAA